MNDIFGATSMCTKVAKHLSYVVSLPIVLKALYYHLYFAEEEMVIQKDQLT